MPMAHRRRNARDASEVAGHVRLRIHAAAQHGCRCAYRYNARLFFLPASRVRMNRKSAVKKSSKAAGKKPGRPPAAPAGKPRATAPTAQAEFSLGAVFAALRKRVPAARQAEAVAFADAFYK